MDGRALQMTTRERALWALAIVLSMALLLAPAIWNGFPLLQYDTGGYLARWYERTLVLSRAVVYGLILNAGAPLAFWPVLVVQAALTVWVIALVLRAHGLGGRPLLLLGIVAVLSVFTTLPWLTSILLTDIFAGLGVLALYLLLLRADALSGARAPRPVRADRGLRRHPQRHLRGAAGAAHRRRACTG